MRQYCITPILQCSKTIKPQYDITTLYHYSNIAKVHYGNKAKAQCSNMAEVQYSIIVILHYYKSPFHRHFRPLLLAISKKSCTFVSARTARGHRQATRPQGDSMRNGIASCTFVLTNSVRHPKSHLASICEAGVMSPRNSVTL